MNIPSGFSMMVDLFMDYMEEKLLNWLKTT